MFDDNSQMTILGPSATLLTAEKRGFDSLLSTWLRLGPAVSQKTSIWEPSTLGRFFAGAMNVTGLKIFDRINIPSTVLRFACTIRSNLRQVPWPLKVHSTFLKTIELSPPIHHGHSYALLSFIHLLYSFLRTIKGIQFENSSDIGVFSKLTNTYCLAAIQGSTNFYSAFESELGDVIPIVHTSIGGTRIIGRLTAGMI
jgi:hypothetical protein